MAPVGSGEHALRILKMKKVALNFYWQELKGPDHKHVQQACNLFHHQIMEGL